MALVALPSPLIFPPFPIGTGTITASSTTINAAGDYGALIFRAPKSGNISKIGYYAGTATGSPAVDVRLETVDSSGLPSGSLKAASANASHSPSSNTFYWVTLTATAAVTKNDLLCIKILYSSGTSLGVYQLTGMNDSGMPYAVMNGSGSPAKSASLLVAGVQYDDGSPGYTGAPITSSHSALSFSLTNATTPDEAGIKFTCPVDCTATGIAARFSGSASLLTYKLYDDANNVLASVSSVDTDEASGANQTSLVLFSSTVDLAAGSVYRVTVLPEDATGITFRQLSVASAGDRAAWPAGTITEQTQRTDAGAWTDSTTKVAFVALLLSHLDDGAGGGGILVNPSMYGGLL